MFGGYNPKGWLGYGEWLDAYLRSCGLPPRPLGARRRPKPVKLGKPAGAAWPSSTRTARDPRGPDGLQINLENRGARSRLGSYYERMPGGGKSIFGAGGGAELKEFRVYVALGDSDMAKKYVPNMFQGGKGELEEIRKNDPGNPEGRDDAEDDARGGGGFTFPWQR